MIARLITPSRCRGYFWLVLLSAAVFLFPTVWAQQNTSSRKVMERTAAPYPPLARSMALSGTVRVEALVSPDGSVKSVEIKGGHPVLAQTAANAVRQWKWESAPRESREIVEIKFSPE